jgi:phage gp45-like
MSTNLRDQVLGWASRIAKWAQFSSNNGFGRGFMQGPEEDPTLGEKPQPQPVRLLQNFGFRSVLRQGSGEGVVIAARGGPANAIAVAVDDQQVGPTDLKEGEVCVYNAKDTGSTKCRIKLDENADVSVNDGTAKVGRVGDKVSVKIYYTTAIVMGTTVVTSISGTAGPNVETLTGQIDRGADHFKA